MLIDGGCVEIEGVVNWGWGEVEGVLTDGGCVEIEGVG